MAWIVEQSENTSAVSVHGNSITCIKDEYYHSPINVLYNDPADRYERYFWQVQFRRLDSQDGGSVAVGLTTERGFQSGWGLKAMQYLSDLSNGSALLVPSFGSPIKQGDRVGLLLELNDREMKFYIFHNDRPLGLAFYLRSPYPIPLYPVVSFNTNGRVRISRSRRIPRSFNRRSEQFTGIEGHWRIAGFFQHPEYIGIPFEIKRLNQYSYHLNAHVINTLSCNLQYNPFTNQWRASQVISTLMVGPPQMMARENVISRFISSIRHLDLHGNRQLFIRTNNGRHVRLECFAAPAPRPVTQNIFI